MQNHTNSHIETLTLSSDTPWNTTITSSSGTVLYTSATENAKDAMYTRVRSTSDEALGVLQWRDVLSDKATIGDAPSTSFNEWVKTSLTPFHDHATFSDDMGRKYRWKGTTSSYSSMELYTEDDNYKEPIARYHRSRRQLVPEQDPKTAGELLTSSSTESLTPTTDGGRAVSMFSSTSTLVLSPPQKLTYTSTPGTLTLLPRAKEIQDLVVLSMLFLEKQSRARGPGFRDDKRMLVYMAGAPSV